ncbi:RsmB/NOP family class I SAM-dependent RNA methyltransferase [Beggiatoa leptomitoformis]|uniref:RNA methyltransferase n=1 Tax=Beggiatoa leptomitoformis TaxID=288004 RepID=A0A2N9YD95_9GAMM|nr:class I SAM-dependent methyltransferase [Beggiatoa leptomitoformis]ALG69149.1 RNA methyltransferase [Beggiatoa leptomitoformis]AUI68431.1 RNA methyltransferase [Beggiatoa leptomitoformis]
MKFHHNLVAAVVHALRAIFVEQQYADKVIERILKSNPRWGARDRGFVAESTYNMVRWWRLLWFLLQQTEAPKQPTDEELWRLFGVWALHHHGLIPPWAELSSLNANQINERMAHARTIRALRESIPEWLDIQGIQELPEQWTDILPALNQQADVVIRVNTLKISRADLAELLQKQAIETSPIEADGLVLSKRQNLFKTQEFQNGLFELQDASSQAVAPALTVTTGMRVIDACAGGGGKTLHLAALMQNKGKIIALDVEAWKLKNLQIRAKRAGADIIESRLIDNRKVIKRLYDSADRLLLDVPCSGLGVLRRNPDTKWKLNPEVMAQVREHQQQILQNYSYLCRQGGQIVYSTCSVLPSENQLQIQAFLESQAGKFTLLSEKTLLPHLTGFDGFYIAVLERVG